MLLGLQGFSGDSINVVNNDLPKRKWYQPDFVTTQFAGNIGFLSVGAGRYLFNNKVQTSFLYGYVPKRIGGEHIHTIAMRNNIDLFSRTFAQNKQADLYFNLGINYETGRNSMNKLEDKYPDGYYSTNSFHFPLSLGIRFSHINYGNRIKKISYFAEVGALGLYLYDNILAQEYSSSSIYSLSFGANFYF